MSDYEIRQKLKEVLRESEESHNVQPAPVALGDVLLELQKSLDRPPEARVPTHLKLLNWFLDGGFGPGELIYLAARAGVGKTALALQFATAAGEANCPTLISSHEMMNAALARRMVAQDAGVSASTMKRKDFSIFERQQVVHSVGRLASLPLWLMDSARTAEHICDVVETLKEEQGLQFLIVDYLQQVRAPKELKERRLQVEYVSSALKAMAMSFGISVLCMSAVSRPAKGASTKPTMESLRESGNLEHDADVILLMHREFDATETEICIGKNRDGSTGLVRVEFEKNYVRFIARDGANP